MFISRADPKWKHDDHFVPRRDLFFRKLAQSDRLLEGRDLMLRIEIEREDDVRWIGDVPALPGVLAYGDTQTEARSKAIALAFRVIADRVEHGERVPTEVDEIFAAA
jgi:predicted RNase H-like HicB family nuclease